MRAMPLNKNFMKFESSIPELLMNDLKRVCTDHKILG